MYTGTNDIINYSSYMNILSNRVKKINQEKSHLVGNPFEVFIAVLEILGIGVTKLHHQIFGVIQGIKH